MEIKQGDKVRVSKDAPKMYFHDKIGEYIERDSEVVDVEKDNAMIQIGIDFITMPYESVVIPTKYLVKVDDEVKEPKFKRGDKVVSKPPFVEKAWTVFGYDDKMPYMVRVGDGEYINERNLEPYTEPTEQTEAEKKPNIGSITIPVEVDLTDSYWDAYTADLAKEVALKVANKFNTPHEAAEYAVSVAKAVVEGLKRYDKRKKQ